MIDFNTEIVTVDLTNSFELQHQWRTNPDTCVRPNLEFDLPVLCQVNKAYGEPSDITSLGKEYDAFAECCPSFNQLNIHQNHWLASNVCHTQFCFTENNTTAMGFDECVYNAGDKLNSDLKLNSTESSTYRGRCEWINYDSLKKGVVDDPADITNAASTPRLLSLALLATTLTGAFLVPSLM
ncbi:hypothetical protein F5B22DRAFT_595843 [Xylaria bambusicola]|uniref:uncharacterized protein n=1 Tax=Xylaria bambusicola TaxID=326684 RepID=UPI0020077B5A|nr:uncharacterized protein F5B22DRAFT_595843 [Xylaria bambusicola]KAI0521674.1 hypothetical protein F5B22DRAFT_595843 [Xylaria bambusicola]